MKNIDQNLTGILDPRYFYLDTIAKRAILNRTIAEDRLTKWNQYYLALLNILSVLMSQSALTFMQLYNYLS